MGIFLFTMLKIFPGINYPGNNLQVSPLEMDHFTTTNPLSIVVQPVDQVDCKGNKATFSVVAEGGVGTIHYQWKRKRATDAAFVTFGAKDSTKLPVYNIGVGTEAPDGTMYQVTVSDQNSVLTSVSASLMVNQITGIAPVGVATYTMNLGDNLWFKVLTSGNIPSAYQWIKKMGPNDWRDLADNSIISGSQRDQLNFTRLSVSDSGLYKLRVTFPTQNGSQCIETSTITRRIYVIADTEPPVFLNLNNESETLCPMDLEQAAWNESLSDIFPERINFYQIGKYSTQFDLAVSNFSDNVTPAVALILHWGIYTVEAPYIPIADNSGNLLDNMVGQISLHAENIDIKNIVTGSQTCQIIFWLEDSAGNLTPVALRHKIALTVPHRPEIISDF